MPTVSLPFAVQPPPAARRPRIVLYSHDTMGLGHVRRNLLLAQTLCGTGVGATALLVSGAVEAAGFELPPGVDCLTLPALSKDSRGGYGARRLDLSLRDVVRLRERTLTAAVQAFQPDLLLTDNVPRGARDELEPALEWMRGRGARCVLGLRDVLDEPSVVAREWADARNEQAVRDYYDEVWVYGDPQVYDLANECDFAATITEKLRYLGYLDQRARLRTGPVETSGVPPALLAGRPLAVCAVGGGQDGFELAAAFARAAAPAGFERVVVAGPHMEPAHRDELRACAARQAGLTVLDFVREPAWLVAQASCLVTMGGYNSVCEALSFRKHALVVPRVSPRREQLIRAERMRARGLLDVIHPSELSPTALSSWMASCARQPRGASVDLRGLERLAPLARRLLSTTAPTRPDERDPRAMERVG